MITIILAMSIMLVLSATALFGFFNTNNVIIALGVLITQSLMPTIMVMIVGLVANSLYKKISGIDNNSYGDAVISTTRYLTYIVGVGSGTKSEHTAALSSDIKYVVIAVVLVIISHILPGFIINKLITVDWLMMIIGVDAIIIFIIIFISIVPLLILNIMTQLDKSRINLYNRTGVLTVVTY